MVLALFPDRRRLLAGLAAAAFLPLRAFAQTRPPKQVLAFYYGWYGAGEHKTLDDAPDMPLGGPYDSLDPAVIARHVAEAREAGLTGLIASWWGQGDRTDQQLPHLLDAAAGLHVSAYIEQGTTPETLGRDILYLYRTCGSHAAWLKLDGRPVIFLYDRVLQTLGIDGWQKARALVEAAAPGALAFVATGNGPKQIAERAPYFDGLHIYDMPFYLAEKHMFDWLWRLEFYHNWVKAQNGLHVTTATVMAGYNDSKIGGRPPPRPIVDRRNGQTFRDLWSAAISADPDWLLIVSFNEWHEGSEIEPSQQNGDRELKTCAGMSAKFRR